MPAGLDECQKCPSVFDRVKLQADSRLTSLYRQAGLPINQAALAREIAIIDDSDKEISDKSQIGLTHFKKKDAKMITLIFYQGDKGYCSHAGHLCVPIAWSF